MTAYRRDSNLEDIIAHSKHKRVFNSRKMGTQDCEGKCVICKHMAGGDTFYSIEGKPYTFKDTVDCKTNNLIYGIYCEVCKCIIYVGETGTRIYDRFQNHLSSIRKNKEEPIPVHFNHGVHRIDHLKIIGIEKLRKRDIHYRKLRETFWIGKLGTLQPKGLNQNMGGTDFSICGNL